ncbi:MAG: NAD(P)-dependent oxidoreductase [Rhodospirillales bacterium]|nr:NAD(P)-dependent oxidoreductase [Rhodospirillales bacterium]
MSRRVLVTGAAGYVGRQTLAPLRARGFEVHAAGRSRPESGGEKVVWHECDLMRGDAVRQLMAALRPSHLLHLAWDTGHGSFWTTPANLDWAAATLVLARAFREAGGARLVSAGTCAEYDWSSEADLDEAGTALMPSTLYGVTKDAARRVIEAYAGTTELSWTWGRLFFSFGPHEKAGRLVPAILAPLLEGKPAKSTAGTQLRDFMDVRDQGAAFAALLDSAVEGPVNIASGEGLAVRDLVTTLAELVGRPDLPEIGALPMRPGEPPRLVAATRRLREEVGFQPAISLRQGLAEAVDWWRR